MSRYYHMQVKITQPKPLKVADIKAATEFEWDAFENWVDTKDSSTMVLNSDGEGSLCTGETEAEFAERLTQAIWVTNGCFCPVDIAATYLDDLPCEAYSLDEDDYHRLMETDN